MSLRPRSNVIIGFQNRVQETTDKPIDNLITEFIDLFKPGTDLKFNLDSKIKFLQIFLKSFTAQFKLVKSKNEKILFSRKFINHYEIVSISLLLNILQFESTKIRLLSLRLILYLSHFEEFNSKFQQLGINNLIVRLIDTKYPDDLCLSIEYIRLLTQLYPDCLNKAIIFSLIAAIEDPKFQLNNFILETMLEIITIRPKLACECNIFNYLIDFILNTTPESDFCIEIIIQTLVKTAEDSECRHLINLPDLLSFLISPLIDIEYTSLSFGNPKDPEGQNEPKVENVINTSLIAVHTLMKSFNGIMLLACNEGKILKTLFSTFSWFLQSNKRCVDKKYILNPSKTTERQILILNSLIDLVYRLFSIEIISEDILKNRKSTGRSMSIITNSSFHQNLHEDDFINQELDTLLEPLDTFSSQSNFNNLTLEHKISIYSTSPNLSITYKAFLIKLFAEIGLFELLLDLYFGLPLSFIQNYTLILKDFDSNSLVYKYEILSLKTLNLFAELYYLINTILYNEYCIDDFTQSDLNSSPYNSEKSVYNEMKKLSLVSYLKELDFAEREKEVIMYITEFNSRKELIKNGLQMQTDQLARLSFYCQQFLANAGFLSSKKFQVEIEALNSQFIDSNEGTFRNQSLSFFGRLFSKSDVENNLEDQVSRQIDQTQVLQFDSNLSNLTEPKQAWNWYEIVKSFEFYFLTKSSFHPRFCQSRYAVEFNSTKFKSFIDNKKIKQFFKKLFEYFHLNDQNLSVKKTTSSSRISFSIAQVSSQFDLIACTGCYLIDFCLHNPQTYENYLNKLLEHIKIYISNEYLQPRQKRNSCGSDNGKNITKDSPLGLYILFIGHLTSSESGDKIIENTKIYELLLEIIEKTCELSLMKLIISTFNFYQSQKSRLILEKCLCLNTVYESYDKELILQYNEFKIYCLKLLLNLFRANSLKFESFYVKIILKSLFSVGHHDFSHEDNDIKASVKLLIDFKLVQIEYYLNLRTDFVEDFLDETANLESFLQYYFVKDSAILKSKIKFLIFRLKLRYQTIKTLDCDTIESLVKEWYDSRLDKLYFKLIERNLFDSYALNSNYTHEIDDRQDNEDNQVSKSLKIYRRINDSSKNLTHFLSYQSQIHVPFHMNRLLARLVDKPTFKSEILDKKTLEQLKFLKLTIDGKTKNVKKLKLVLWSLGSLCISEEGFKYVSKLIENIFKNLFDFTCSLIQLAENHTNLSVRSTCFICLNLISKSCTGANLIGKLGWHTFQPNRFTPTRAFYALLSSLSKEQQELSIYSSIDTAIILYNINRSKSSLGLKKIKKYFDCGLSNYEIDYLCQRDKINLEKQSDTEFIKFYDKNKIGVNFDNLTVPVRITLMAVGVHGAPEIFKSVDKVKKFECIGCLKCYIKNRGLIRFEDEINDEKVINEIIDNIDGIVPFIDFEETYKQRIKRLSEIKKQYPNCFDICLYSFIISNYMSVFRTKYKLRKILNDLFNDLNF